MREVMKRGRERRIVEEEKEEDRGRKERGT